MMYDEFWDIQIGTGNHEGSKYAIPRETCWMAPTEREQILGREGGKQGTNFDGVGDGVDDNYDDADVAVDRYVYEWSFLDLPLDSKTTEAAESTMTLHLRTIKSNVALLESHVGEELWDAAKVFCAHLCLSHLRGGGPRGRSTGAFIPSTAAGDSYINLTHKLRGKKVLELGAGVASLGMCIAALGYATEVLCTDYDGDVLDNLRFNLEHNAPNLYANLSGRREMETETETDGVSSSSSSITPTLLKWAKLDWEVLAWDDNDIYVDLDVDVDVDDDTTNHTGGRNTNCTVHRPRLENDARATDVDEHHDAVSDAMRYHGDAYMYDPDIVVGSALVYSAEGASYCADTIHYFLTERGAEEAWVLQMPERPGFDRCLMRLERRGLTYDTYKINEDVFHLAESIVHTGRDADVEAGAEVELGMDTLAGNKKQMGGAMASDIDDFRLFVIKKKERS